LLRIKGSLCYNLAMPYVHADPRVDKFISKLPKWQKDICARIRQLIHEAEPAIEETIKRGDRPYFVLQGNVCALQATKDHINVFIYDPIAPDPGHIINQGHGNETARSIQIYENDPLNGEAFKALIKAVADNNRAGGWHKLKKLTN
jgi:hypothetical protein